MAASSSLVAKAGIAGTVISGGGLVGTYYAWDHITLYEVEREVINGKDLEFSVNKSNEDWVIKVAKENNKEWTENSGYYWECKITGASDISITKADLEVRLFDIFGGNTKEIRRRLVQVCSEGRDTPTSNKVKSSISFSKGKAADNKQDWEQYLFGPNTLNEVEEAVVDNQNNVYFTVTNSSNNNSPWAITAAAKNNDKFKSDEGYGWKCEISGPSGLTIETNTIEDKIPKESEESSLPDNKKANRKRLVYACSKERKLENNKVSSTFTFPTGTTTSDWSSKLMFE